MIPNLSLKLLATCLLLGLSLLAEQELGYMAPFSTAEFTGKHVNASSYAVPDNFVDGQWHGIIVASDGKTYFSVSSHSPAQSAQFYRFDSSSQKPKVEKICDVAAWCGQTESIGKWNAQGKIHSQIFEANGKLYCSTTPAHREPDHPYEGGHFLSYDLATRELQDLGLFPDSHGGLLTMLHEPANQRLYAISQGNQTLCYLDLKNGKITKVGSCQENPLQTRTLIADKQGNVYGCEWGNRVWRYSPETNEIELLDGRLPGDPDQAQPEPDPDSRAWQSTQWKLPVWDPQTRWWYAVKGNDEYLFRFRLPERGSTEIVSEGLAPFGFRPRRKAEQRLASLAFVRRGRELFYCSYPVWRPMAHLMRYQIDTGKVTDLGPIVTDDGHRRVAEIHGMVVGADGKLHAVGMVWSRENSRDPANPWANRGQCYFHARLLVIDPDQDFQPSTALNGFPAQAPTIREYAPGRQVQLSYPPTGASGPFPALILIHGGGWGSGSPDLLAPMAGYFADRGMLVANIGYRLTSQTGVRVPDCVTDVKLATRWVADHAEELDIDPERIVVAGESAGGHLAACVGMVPGFLPDGTPEPSIAALVLYNPVIDTASEDGWQMRGYSEAERQALSPAHHVRQALPPTLIVHGKADTCTPFAWSERFVQAMRQAGNEIEFEELDGVGHAFLIPGYGTSRTIAAAIDRTDDFLSSQGMLAPLMPAAWLGDASHLLTERPPLYVLNPDGKRWWFQVHRFPWWIGKGWNNPDLALTVIDPNGDIVLDETRHVGGETRVWIPAGAPGVYRIDVDSNNSLNYWSLRGSLPHAVVEVSTDTLKPERGGHDRRFGGWSFNPFIPRRWYFHVPEGTERFRIVAINNKGRSHREDHGLTVYSPRGQRMAVLWGQANPDELPQKIAEREFRLQQATIIVEPGSAGRFWSIEIRMGDSHTYSDINLILDGVPPYLAQAPEWWFDPRTGERPKPLIYDESRFVQSDREGVADAIVQHWTPCPSFGDPDGCELGTPSRVALHNPEGRDLKLVIGTYLPRGMFPDDSGKLPEAELPHAAVTITSPNGSHLLAESVPLHHLHHGDRWETLLDGVKGTLLVEVRQTEHFWMYTYPATRGVLIGEELADGWGRFHLEAGSARDWYFHVPAGTTSFALHYRAHRESDVIDVEIHAPDRLVARHYGQMGQLDIEVPPGLGGLTWHIRLDLGGATLFQSQQPRFPAAMLDLQLKGVPFRLAPTYEQWFPEQ